MLKGKRLAIVGAGQMGEALLKGFLLSNIFAPDLILLSDVSKERLESLKEKYRIDITSDNFEAIRASDIVLLAIKPQQMQQVLSEAKGAFYGDNKLVISIAAGVKTEKIQNLIAGKTPVVRVMPNTPALVGKGMSVISRGRYADDESIQIALKLFSSVGEVIELPEEVQNQATAISGSGPAYFFLMVEALMGAAVEAGLDENTAGELVIQTMAGSAALLLETGRKAGDLRKMVTSPGGTTAAALQVFSNREFKFIVQEAVESAIKRAGELA